MEHNPSHPYEGSTQNSVLAPEGERVVKIAESFSNIVVTTDQYAYKIRKPIKDGLIDYSTFDRRLNCAQRELSKGRIFSGDHLYITILPVTTLTDGKFLIGRETQPDNIAIKMFLFNDKDILSNRIMDKRLPEDWESMVVNYLLSVHKKTKTDKKVGEYGHPNSLKYLLNFYHHQISDKCVDISLALTFNKILSELEDFINLHRSIFMSRLEGGYIRDNHGDLHTGNILLDINRDQIFAFDPIEYHMALSAVDTFSDISYLLFDLDFLERSDLSSSLEQKYIKQTGEDEVADIMLAFYKSWRALVRAKVGLFLDGDQKSMVTSCLNLANHYLSKL